MNHPFILLVVGYGMVYTVFVECYIRVPVYTAG